MGCRVYPAHNSLDLGIGQSHATQVTFPWSKKPPPEVADRIPPGQVLTEKFPVLHFGRVPEYGDLSAWTFRVFGQVEQPLSLTWAEVRALPTTEVTLDIHCVTRWSKLDTTWEGVPFSHIVEAAQPKSSARFVIFHSEAGYTANVPIETTADPHCMLAWNYAGERLTAEHGYPLRAIVPGKYFWKSAKWLRGIEFSAEDQLGFWERNGYSNSADPWREERYSGG
jgi:DMSO/TMAO reductase YedYZ molybdopterin-dependent catalytic subunit